MACVICKAITFWYPWPLSTSNRSLEPLIDSQLTLTWMSKKQGWNLTALDLLRLTSLWIYRNALIFGLSWIGVEYFHLSHPNRPNNRGQVPKNSSWFQVQWHRLRATQQRRQQQQRRQRRWRRRRQLTKWRWTAVRVCQASGWFRETFQNLFLRNFKFFERLTKSKVISGDIICSSQTYRMCSGIIEN